MKIPESVIRSTADYSIDPRLIRAGLALLIVLPFVFLILLFVIPNKVAMLTTWILSIIIIDAFLIVVEYMRDRYARSATPCCVDTRTGT